MNTVPSTYQRRSRVSLGLLALGCLAAFPAASAGDPKGVVIPPPPAAGRWTFSAGPVWRQIGDVSFNTGTTPAAIPPVFGGNSFTEPPGIGTLGGYADRTYDDGYVNIGAGTPITGLTTNWGYTSAGQVQGSNLVYSRAGGQRREVFAASSVALASWAKDADTEVGPYLELSYAIPVRDNVTVGAGVNFSMINIGAARNGLNTFTQSQVLNVYDVTAVDTYALGRVIPPAAPYNGTFAGPGPLINNIPTSRAFPEMLNNTQTAVFSDLIAENLDLDFYTIGLGGQVAWWPCTSCFVRAEGGLAVNLADWNATRDERVMQSLNGGAATQWSRRVLSRGDNEVLFGLYLQTAVGWQIDDHWSVQAFGRYDWNEGLSSSIGTSTFNVDLDGWSAGLAVGYRF